MVLCFICARANLEECLSWSSNADSALERCKCEIQYPQLNQVPQGSCPENSYFAFYHMKYNISCLSNTSKKSLIDGSDS